MALVGGGSTAWAQTSGPGLSDLALAGLTRHQHIPDEVLVQYRPGTTTAAKGRALGRVFGRFQENVVNGGWRGDGRGDLDLVKLPAGLTIAGAARLLQADPNVEFAEPNWVYQHHATSNDPYFTNGSLWGMGPSSPASSGLGSGASGAATAWANGKTGSDTVYVAIIDEGCMINHPDLSANVGVNPGEIPGNGRDDDGNGYVDDVNGWDFANNDRTVFDGVGDDHGTHVAGTIGARGGNEIGVAGVVWNVKFITAKFLGSRGGTTANAIKAVDYVTNLKKKGLNIVASNNSWGGGASSQALYDAIERANAENILFVAAAGNSSNNNDAVPSYPASYSNANVISVAAIDSSGGLASFSNYGVGSVHLGAPGVGIWSTVPVSQKGKISSGYASYNGTSMATPHVTGACALYKSIYPTATAAQIKQAILSSATFTDSLNGRVKTWGRLNVSGF